MKISIEELYKSGRGIKTLGGKVFYPTKARTCRNCCLLKYNSFSMPDGCYDFDTEVHNGRQRPTGICIPVKDRTGLSEIRAEDVMIWIEENLER